MRNRRPRSNYSFFGGFPKSFLHPWNSFVLPMWWPPYYFQAFILHIIPEAILQAGAFREMVCLYGTMLVVYTTQRNWGGFLVCELSAWHILMLLHQSCIEIIRFWKADWKMMRGRFLTLNNVISIFQSSLLFGTESYFLVPFTITHAGCCWPLPLTEVNVTTDI